MTDVIMLETQRKLYEAMREFLIAKGLDVDPKAGLIIPIRYCEKPEIPVELIASDIFTI